MFELSSHGKRSEGPEDEELAPMFELENPKEE